MGAHYKLVAKSRSRESDFKKVEKIGLEIESRIKGHKKGKP